MTNVRFRSIGLALTDTLDDLIEGERINPQLAMKILGTFDQAITEALQKNVKNRLQFKVDNQRLSSPKFSYSFGFANRRPLLYNRVGQPRHI
jgi:hypothetical protein